MWNDKNFVLEQIKRDPHNLRNASKELRNDPEIVEIAISKNGISLKHASDSIKNCKEIVLKAVQNCGFALQFACEILRIDNKVAMYAVKQDGNSLKFCGSGPKGNWNVVFEAVKQNGNALQFASPKLRKHFKIVFAAAKQNIQALQYAGILSRKEILKILNWNWRALEYLGPKVKNTKFFVLKCVKWSGMSLQFASEELRNDKEVVFEAFKRNNISLKYANLEIRNDKEFLISLMKHKSLESALICIKFASKRLLNCREFVLKAVKIHGKCLKFASNELRNDRDIVLEAVKQNSGALKHACKNLQGDKEIVMAALNSKQGRKRGMLKHAGVHLQNDKEFISLREKNVYKSFFKLMRDRKKKPLFLKSLYVYNITEIKGVDLTQFRHCEKVYQMDFRQHHLIQDVDSESEFNIFKVIKSVSVKKKQFFPKNYMTKHLFCNSQSSESLLITQKYQKGIIFSVLYVYSLRFNDTNYRLTFVDKYKNSISNEPERISYQVDDIVEDYSIVTVPKNILWVIQSLKNHIKTIISSPKEFGSFTPKLFESNYSSTQISDLFNRIEGKKEAFKEIKSFIKNFVPNVDIKLEAGKFGFENSKLIFGVFGENKKLEELPKEIQEFIFLVIVSVLKICQKKTQKKSEVRVIDCNILILDEFTFLHFDYNLRKKFYDFLLLGFGKQRQVIVASRDINHFAHLYCNNIIKPRGSGKLENSSISELNIFHLLKQRNLKRDPLFLKKLMIIPTKKTNFFTRECKIEFHEHDLLLGRSGCGKTTLLNLIRTMRQNSGFNIINSGKVNFIFQSPKLDEKLFLSMEYSENFQLSSRLYSYYFRIDESERSDVFELEFFEKRTNKWLGLAAAKIVFSVNGVVNFEKRKFDEIPKDFQVFIEKLKKEVELIVVNRVDSDLLTDINPADRKYEKEWQDIYLVRCFNFQNKMERDMLERSLKIQNCQSALSLFKKNVENFVPDIKVCFKIDDKKRDLYFLELGERKCYYHLSEGKRKLISLIFNCCIQILYGVDDFKIIRCRMLLLDEIDAHLDHHLREKLFNFLCDISCYVPKDEKIVRPQIITVTHDDYFAHFYFDRRISTFTFDPDFEQIMLANNLETKKLLKEVVFSNSFIKNWLTLHNIRKHRKICMTEGADDEFFIKWVFKHFGIESLLRNVEFFVNKGRPSIRDFDERARLISKIFSGQVDIFVVFDQDIKMLEQLNFEEKKFKANHYISHYRIGTNGREIENYLLFTLYVLSDNKGKERIEKFLHEFLSENVFKKDFPDENFLCYFTKDLFNQLSNSTDLYKRMFKLLLKQECPKNLVKQEEIRKYVLFKMVHEWIDKNHLEKCQENVLLYVDAKLIITKYMNVDEISFFDAKKKKYKPLLIDVLKRIDDVIKQRNLTGKDVKKIFHKDVEELVTRMVEFINRPVYKGPTGSYSTENVSKPPNSKPHVTGNKYMNGIKRITPEFFEKRRKLLGRRMKTKKLVKDVSNKK